MGLYPLLDEASQETAVLGSCLQAQPSVINSVKGWLSPMGWGSDWGSHWLAVPSVSVFTPARLQVGQTLG